MVEPGSSQGGIEISVCVIAFKTSPVLLRMCLDSVDKALAAYGESSEILVQDNSGDTSLQVQFGRRASEWVVSENVGFARAANGCVQRARGRYILLLNPDACLESNSVQAFMDAYECLRDTCQVADNDRDQILLGGWLVTDSGDVQVDALTYWVFSTSRLMKRRWRARRLERESSNTFIAVDKVSGGACFAQKESLIKLGPFDERYFLYGEDADMSRRAIKGGFRLFAVPAARVLHKAASSQATHSELVELARADAAIRQSSYNCTYAVSLAFRVEFAIITVLGALAPARKTSSGSRQTRIARLRTIVWWGTHRDREAWRPLA